ncbi:hypothetical protein [Dyella sp.]|uniref:hypothetical protein n=1 Tax=Dyella sp. TaxID=1869338 RepID=UPI002847A99D|nr:hypothetical protein [Dyella sp.]MDR3445147.1 hypothetical protein [Dyella sp.]
MKKSFAGFLARMKNNRIATGSVLALAAVPAFADAGTFDTSIIVGYSAGVIAAIGIIGAAWVGVSYLKKGWKALRGV